MPPPVDISMQQLEQLPGGRGHSCQIVLTRQLPAAAGTAMGANSTSAQQYPGAHQGAGGTFANSGAVAGQAGTFPDSSSNSTASFSPCKLLVGCSGTDELLLLRSLVVEKFDSPMQVRARCHVVLLTASCMLHSTQCY